ncbi:divalent-cation tolerance protein CutA [Dehalococcoides mccartyi]|uniref:divalent-cation tolerance protein CutA n=1 Tax=Dehalococcoides mccartyi TaxID=61435 RepID=UPI001F50FC23|nr:divalent-cation tolerance protein CutA [Dehalococcoides mccartyi]UJP38228.1 divalent-cation tolerance protein CutA [Dehalococcoides mccartyi]
MKTNSFLVVFITAKDAEEAALISKVLLTQRKAACVSIVPRVNSQYWWQGKIEESAESLLIVKTRQSMLDSLIEVVHEVHSYENPEILALPVGGGSPEYLDWLDKELSAPPDIPE